ncbi:MAG TPA: YhdP family protein [Woeseiaceae bacterium]|nr:YhdP family protein [Woeseiaceae bacterium]
MKFAAYTAATVVILMAIAIGLFRLFLPRLPEYQDEIKRWASTAIGMQVEFSGMDARWGLRGPELEFYDAELIQISNGARIVAADQVRVGIGFMRLLFDRALIVDRLVIRETSINVQQLEDNSFRVQGIPINELLSGGPNTTTQSIEIEVVGEDIELRFMQPGDERPHFFDIPSLSVSIDDNRVAADATVRLPQDLGRQLKVSATQILTMPVAERSWDLIIDGDKINLVGWSGLARRKNRFESGSGDIELAIGFGREGINNAVAEIDFEDVALPGESYFDARGRLEIDVSSGDWLIAANEFVVAFDDHVWPESTLIVEASVDDDGKIVMVDTRASYLPLGDLHIASPWLGDEQKEMLESYGPSGIVRNLRATVADIGSDKPRFNVSAELDGVGFRNAAGRPGVRGFSGLVRANRAGGMLEIQSRNLEIDAPGYVPRVIPIDTADGAIIWRNSANQTTILSDSIVIRSAFFDSQSNVQVVLDKGGGSPVIDLASSWSIPDLAAARLYIPTKGLKPKLYNWFQMALVGGSIPQGTTTFNGPLDKFPFDGGEGRLLIEASVRNTEFKYHEAWPPAEQADLEVVVDNARLYSVRNRSFSSGNLVVDASIEIPDLRNPVLMIDSFSTGTLETIHDFSMQSPIAKVFGGQLDRIQVSGEASFSLELLVPLKQERLQEFEFLTRVRSNNGTLAIEGFAPPVTDLIGEVTISRDAISSEGLGARFLGSDVDIDLTRSEEAAFSIVATTKGTITADGIVNELGVPLDGLVQGSTAYQAQILFPDGKAPEPSPLTIRIHSEMDGLAFLLPEPLAKADEAVMPFRGELRFMPGGEAIESSGIADERITWQLAFNKPEGSWDFDRGVVALGADISEPADTRGLHIRGRTDIVRFQDWLDLSRSGEKNLGAADRIRSIDVQIDNLYLIGQHLQNHRIQVDRSALDWLVQFEGDDISGSVFVPYDFGGDRAMVLEMEKLRLPGDEQGVSSIGTLDPRRLPPIQLSAAEFAFGDRYLGRVEANLEKTPLGLNAISISSKDESSEIVGTGRWEADENDPLGSHSYVSAVLTSNDVKKTMERLNYQLGIVSDELRMVFDLNWSGSPRGDFFDVLDGEVEVRVVDGQLEEIKPGAGRVFGLMSITALPRRLSFDFRDVFNKGFGFDTITGTFRIDDGRTYTCNLSLEGPAADIGIVGVADLANRTYDQTAVVAANVGNSLPIVGAVVAGPQVAAALLIFSQIFKKPLQEVGQVYYGISGSWDEPDVESSDSDAFVASGELAGCLPDGQ